MRIDLNRMAGGLLAACLLTASAARAATLTTVPMQGGMVMPMISYSTNDARLHVMMPPDVPQMPMATTTFGSGI